MLAVFLLGAYSIMITGCGGGGSSGPAPDDGMMGGEPPAMCPEGEVGTPPDCMVPGPSEEEIAAATKAAGTKRAAIMAESSQGPGQTPTNDDAGLGGSASDGTAVDTYSMTIERDSDGTTVKITDSANAGDDDPKFAQTMDLGGGTTMHSRAMEADDDGNVVEEVVMVSTDIEAPKATAFAMVTGQALNARDLDTGVDADDDGDMTNDYTALTLIAVGADGANLSKVMAAAFDPVANVPSKSFAIDDATTTSMDEAFETSGTYNGASGTYRCNGTVACTATYADGKLASLTGDWVFTPDAGATSDVPDADFLHYGFWLKKTTDDDGVVTYNEVETFADSEATATPSTTNITGKATYSGGALGVYVHSVTKPDGTEASATSGHFTADAELTAYFGQVLSDPDDPSSPGTIAPNLLNKISGTINNFMLSGHDQGPGWSVTLEPSAITPADASVAPGVAKGGGDEGSYSATFHGGDDTSGSAVQPTSVVGEFNAFFSNGSVAGAFGATKD